MVQGRFLFKKASTYNPNLVSLNPFGAGTFFIQNSLLDKWRLSLVLIPLVQGRFLFLKEENMEFRTRLNPFVSGSADC